MHADTTRYLMCVCRADELWRHLVQLGIYADDRDAELPFGKHPTKILEGMEHSRCVDTASAKGLTQQLGGRVYCYACACTRT
jgi:hypothetical protein